MLFESGLTHVLSTSPGDEPIVVLDQRSGRAIDHAAATEFGLPTLLLMENAAVWLAAYAAALVPPLAHPSALIFAGKGNNGGDGLAMARHLVNRGWRVAAVLAAAPASFTGDAAVNLRICERLGVALLSVPEHGADRAIERAVSRLGRVDLAVDALLGTGLSGPLQQELAGIIRSVNRLQASGTPVLAIDIPSGLDADSGLPSVVAGGTASGDEPERLAVRADVTVTLVGLKPGFLELAAQPYVGELLIADIGVPRTLLSRLGTPLAETKRPGRGASPSRTAGEPLPYRPGEPPPPKRR